MQEVKKVVIIGPESTGKSTLCKQLATHFSTFWCPEYAREYLLKNGTNYTFENLLDIAKGQLTLEDEYVEKVNGQWCMGNKEDVISNDLSPAVINQSLSIKSKLNTQNSICPLLFLDTDMYVMKVWCEFVFQKCHQFILDQVVERRYHLYLLCNTDLPWVKDKLREYPDHETREKLYHIYRDILVNQQVPWVEIRGNYAQRLQLAIEATSQMLTSLHC